MLSWFHIVALSIVEGITEFLPVSSTGHMILARDFMGLPESEALDAFLVIVQAGAIFAVITVFWKTFRNWLQGWLRPKDVAYATARFESILVFVSMIPASVVGLMFGKIIKAHLFGSVPVAIALIVGGVLILAVESWTTKRHSATRTKEDFSFGDAVALGCFQCLALFPGFSRSASIILGGRLMGFDRAASAEVSFLVGFPTLLAAAGYETLKSGKHLTGQWIPYLAVGLLISWAVAWVCVKGFVAFLRRFSMAGFGYYRIVLGVVVLWWFSLSGMHTPP